MTTMNEPTKKDALGPPTAPRPDIIPDDLKAVPQWVVWRYERRQGEEKPTKVLYDAKVNPSWKNASSTDPGTWASFEQAYQTYLKHCRTPERVLRDREAENPARYMDGIGFVLTEADGFVGIDFDGCVDPDTGKVSPDVLAMVEELGTYTELSPSGKGLRAFAKGKLPPRGRKKGPVEFYERARFLTVTGLHLPGTPETVEERQQAISLVHEQVFGPQDQKAPRPAQTPIPQGAVIVDDAERLDIACAAKNGDKFKRLYYDGDTTGYQSPSEARMALAGRLAFYSGPDPERIDRLFRGSALMDEKWDSKRGDTTIGGMTIETALEGRTEFYTPPARGVGDYGETHLSDLGNARRMMELHGDRLRFVPKWKAWIGYDETRWAVDENGAVRRMAHETIASIYADAEGLEGKEQEKLRAFALASETESRINAMVNEARWLEGVAVSPNELDADPYLLNVRNGTLDLRTGELLPHDRKDLMMKTAPVVFDPTAKCPLWDAFLERVQPDPETRGFLRRAAGYSLTGITSAQCFFFLFGVGQNGKTVFTDILRELLGKDDYWGKTKAETLMHMGRPQGGANNDVADLFGKRLISVAEMDEGMRLNEGLIKDLTGDEAITARQLYEKNVTWLPTFKIWFYGNHMPEIRGSDGGIKRRPKMIPFTVVIPDDEKDEHLKDKLKAELSGILNWAVAGCLEWARDGLGDSPQIKEATQKYLADMDVIGTFLDECCEGNARGEIAASDFYRVYAAWAKQNGEYVKTNKRFGMSLTERGYRKERKNAGVFYQGVAFTNEGLKLQPFKDYE